MGFLNYLLMGVVALGLGWAIRVYYLDRFYKHADSTASKSPFHLTHPKIISILAVFFVVMLGVSWALGQFVLHHQGIDWAFVIINSLVATFIFSFGLSPDSLA